jgi:hypothetical protein
MLIFFLLLAGVARAQNLVSAKAGMIQYIEGDVFLDDKLLRLGYGDCVQMENGQSLRTRHGRAEMLVTTDIYLRLGRHGLLRMELNRLDDIQFSLEQGSALIEVVKRRPKNEIHIRFADGVIELKKNGLYRLDAGSGRLSVYGGEARVAKGGKEANIKSGKMAHLNTNLILSQFDLNVSDSLHRWAAIRSYILFTRSPSTRTQDHWPQLSLGWRTNFNYRMRLHPDVLFDLIEENLREEALTAPEYIDKGAH